MKNNLYLAVIMGALLLAPFHGVAHGVATMEGTALNYIHTDHLTGSNAVTNSTAGMVQLLDYYPYGGLRIDWRYGSFDEQRKFAGHEYDRDTDLSYMESRYYNGGIGRFISQDPAYLLLGDADFEQRYGRKLEQHLADPQQLNSYSYVANNPLTYVDETGEIAPLLIAGALIAWQTAEAGLTAYDAYSTYQTVTSANATKAEKTTSVALFALGVAGPGGGYKSAGDGALKGLRNLDKAWDVVRASEKHGWGNPKTLLRHFNDHGADFGAKNPADYAKKANEFITNKQYTHTFKEGKDTVYWNKDTNIAVYTNKSGDISSAYKVTNENKINTYQRRAVKQK